MNRFLVAAVSCAVAAVAAGPTAAATPWSGTIVAKDAARSAVVAVSQAGAVRTVRVSKARLTTLQAGRRVSVVATRLADGTFRSVSLRLRGEAKRATLRAVVVRNQPGLRRTIVSAGGTVFAIARSRTVRTTSSGRALRAGDLVFATLAFGARGDGPRAVHVRAAGRVSTVELEGIFTGLSGSRLSVAVVRHGLLSVAVPDGATLPALHPGDLVELLATVGPDGSFTLVALDADDADDHGLEADEGEDEIEVEGQVSSLDPLTVAPERGLAVSCALARGFSLDAILVGDHVEMTCDRVGSSWILRRLQAGDEADEDEEAEEEEEVEVEGRLTSLDPVRVEPSSGAAVSCAVPAGLTIAGFQVGDVVEMECERVAGTLTVTELEREDDEHDDDPDDDEDDADDDDEDEDGD